MQTDICAFMIISRLFLLRMRNVSDKCGRENRRSHFEFNNFFRKSCTIRNRVQTHRTDGQATDDNIIRRMCLTCWVTKATDTNSEYAIHILTAFPRQKYFSRTIVNVTFIGTQPVFLKL
jgi:hypothetical protein